MIVTNQTSVDYWFGPLHLPAGVGQTLTVDDTSETSVYLLSDAVADAVNNLYQAGKITVSGQAAIFPRPTGVPQVLHGDGAPEGMVYAPQGSVYMRRDGDGTNGGTLYMKTTGITLSTGWETIADAAGTSVGMPTGTIADFGGSTAPGGWLICDGSAVSRTTYSLLFGIIGTDYGSGDGSTTFNLPDLRGRISVGFAASGGHTDVSTLGNNDGVALQYRRPKHRHTTHHHTTASGQQFVTGSGSFGTAGGGGAVMGSEVNTNSVDGGSGNSNDSIDAPAYLVVNRIIKT